MNMHRVVFGWAILMACAGCTPSPIVETDIGSAAPFEGYEFSRLNMGINIYDYEGRYSLLADLDVAVEGPLSEVRGELHDLQKETYIPFDEPGRVDELTLSHQPGVMYYERPVYTFTYSGYFEEIGCQIDLNGDIREAYPPDSIYSDFPFYEYVGPVDIACPGVSMILDSEEAYQSPGELVGYVSSTFYLTEIEAEAE